jgi:transcriptional regulator with GAF, ATPase, and Fis domain
MINNAIEIIVPDDIRKNWQEIVDLLARLCGVPAALIMRTRNQDIEVFVSSDSAGNPYRTGESERLDNSGLYCESVIKSGEKLLVPDALADNRWKTNPDVKRNMISYLGFPIFLPDKKTFGTVCVLDNKHNGYSGVIEQLMLKLKEIIESHLEMIYVNQCLVDKNKRLSDYLMEIQAFRGIVPICSHCKAIKDQQGEWHPVEDFLIRHPEADFSHGICPECLARYYPDFRPEP